MWSLYVGRPESIDHLDITVQPAIPAHPSGANKKWSPYIDEGRGTPDWECPSSLDEVAQATIELCSKMASIRKVLYVDTRHWTWSRELTCF